MTPWIKVCNGLPPDDLEVLFVNGKNEVSVGRMMSKSNDGSDIWATQHSIYFNDSLEQEWCTCKFWTSLPKPPGDK